jgi:hypothetical protein
MQNLFLVPTEKPTRLYKNGLGVFELSEKEESVTDDTSENYHVYIVSSEKIKEHDWFLDENNELKTFIKIWNYKKLSPDYKKVIMTTNPVVIKAGIKAIDDEFLEWFIKNPSCRFVEVSHQLHKDEPLYKIIIPQEEPNPFEIPKALPDDVFYQSLEPKQETLEEAIKPLANFIIENATPIEGQDGAYYHFSEVCKLLKLQSKRMYSEEEVMDMFHNFSMHLPLHYEFLVKEQFKKK